MEAPTRTCLRFVASRGAPLNNAAGEVPLEARPGADEIGCHMSNEHVREIVVRRARLREALKPIKVYWHSGPLQPDWLFITQVTGQGGHESFDLQSVRLCSAACGAPSVSAVLTGYMSYETLRIAKDQAHADLGIEYVEWEPCHVEITNPDGSLEWGRALPPAEQGACT